jgi:four helix bundle protein
MQNFKELKVWQKAHRLTLDVYKVTTRFPKDEMFGLTSQMRRSSASIPTNIAEGCGRDSRAELARFLSIAMGSASELEYQLILAKDLTQVSIFSIRK